jgi:hypothetical protein
VIRRRSGGRVALDGWPGGVADLDGGTGEGAGAWRTGPVRSSIVVTPGTIGWITGK